MMTVKEISERTGISVRTLHYYDEIGLLTPSRKSDAGYRLYDEKALELLQQILFFREFDIPLKEIKTVMENPSFDRIQILQMQRGMLVKKKERMERLIASIDGILKGDNKMDFKVFTKSDIEELAQATIDHMPESVLQATIKDFGSVEAWKKHYVERASKEDMQKGYQKMVEWYGSKEQMMAFAKNPPSQEVVKSYGNRIDHILDKLIQKRHCPLDSFEVKEIIGEYGFVMKQLYQIQKEDDLMKAIAKSYHDEKMREETDKKYGEHAAEFFASAIENFYK